jgi:SAM-dependent methyltransferase/predicted  nucleic acid-binding Zn-ribbon protein
LINPKLKRLAGSLGQDENAEAESRREIVLDMIGSGKRVLEFGCAEGDLSRLLAAAGNRVTGIETAGPSAGEARSSCEEVVVADLDARSLSDILPSRTYDVVVFDNVLEYVRDPRRVLEESRRFLGPGGYAVIAVPNVAHGSIRLALLRGRFDVQNGGPLERSSLRLFTLKSVHELCFRAGFRVVAIERTKAPLAAPDGSAQKLKPGDFDREILREIETDPEHDTVQFVIRAAPLGDEERLAALVTIAVDAELRSSEARSALARIEAEAADVRERAVELEERVASQSSERSRAGLEIAALRERLERAEREVEDSHARLERLPDAERSIGEAHARAEILADQLRLANERVTGYERRIDALHAQNSAFGAEAAAIRTALDRATEELAASRDAALLVRETFDVEVGRLGEAIAEWQDRVALARDVAEEANRERDVAVAARDVAEETSRRLQRELNESNLAAEKRAGAIEDLRFQLEREATNLRDVLADRDRIRHAHEAQQSAAVSFFAHVEAELARTRREILQIDGMIRQVQSSRWWIVKRALGKARRIVVSKLRR